MTGVDEKGKPVWALLKQPALGGGGNTRSVVFPPQENRGIQGPPFFTSFLVIADKIILIYKTESFVYSLIDIAS